MDYISIQFPADGISGFGPSPKIAGWLFVPRSIDPDQQQTVALCIHGGGYDKRYFHIEAPGLDGYSMCRHLAEKGVIALAIDWLGTGESARAEAAENITQKTLCRAHHAASLRLLEGLKNGTLTPEIPPLPLLASTGLGHSMGGMLTILQQAEYRSFDRIAILGWSNLGATFPPSVLKSLADQASKYVHPSAELRRVFHMMDVPPAVLDSSAEREIVPISATLLGQVPNLELMRDAAGQIEEPIFLSYSENDVSPSPYDEMACFRKSDDITFFRLMGSAHAHNFSTTRHMLWNRIAGWMKAMAST